MIKWTYEMIETKAKPDLFVTVNEHGQVGISAKNDGKYTFMTSLHIDELSDMVNALKARRAELFPQGDNNGQ